MNKVSNLLHMAAVCSVVAFFTACASDSGETGITPPIFADRNSHGLSAQ